MSDENVNDVIDAAKSGDVEALTRLLAAGGAVNQRDDQGWTPLNWAAGRGDVPMLRLLLDRGADITLTGRDNRTPLMIAKAAGRKEVAAALTAAEQTAGIWLDPRLTRSYCKAFYLRDLRGFPGWSEAGGDAKQESSSANGGRQPEAPLVAAPLVADDIVYLHQDLTVTRSMWHGEESIFDAVTPDWREFCTATLAFEIPEDLL
ncbi:MAG TPA: ankyrin repeat domain-containing protein [Thermoanaerobaculia bacterium]|nr:ankyrin repeat domain-containing protein [Thermoanaerobaculia bacterium]